MIHKKGSRCDPNNFRPICLLSHAYKVLSKILTSRIYEAIDSNLSDLQNGFRNSRGCRDNIFILREVIREVCKSETDDVFADFIDYKAAFDSCHHAYLRLALTEHSVPDHIVELIMIIYSESGWS
jgi:hypothetical protein